MRAGRRFCGRLKPILAISLLAQALPASATEENWIFLSATKSRDFFIDSSSIIDVSAGRKTARIKQVLRNSSDDPDISEIYVLVEYDCHGRRTRFLEGTAIFKNGNRETKRQVLEWSVASSSLSNDGIQIDYVCSGKVPSSVNSRQPPDVDLSPH
jgi:hypothetical protein